MVQLNNQFAFTVFPLSKNGVQYYTAENLTTLTNHTVFVGPCHHGMARPQVADGGTASDMEGSCE